MDQLIALLTRKNIVALLILAVLAAGLLVGLRLVQQQTQLKSKAAEIMPLAPTAPYPCQRDNQPQIGVPVGRCAEVLQDPPGCYETAYSHYIYTKDGDGDGVADPQKPNDQPWCDNTCAGPKQCPTASPSPSPGAAGAPACDPSKVNLSVSPQQVQVGENISFSLSGSQGSTWVGDTWSGGVDCSGGFWPSKTCKATTAGTFTWTHTWQNTALNNFDIKSAVCSSNPVSFTVTQAQGGNVGVGGVDVASCDSITTDGQDYKKHPGLVINPTQPYKIKISMSNIKVGIPQSNWKSGYYLKYTGGSATQLGLSASKVEVPSPPVLVGESRSFDVTINPTIAGIYQFYWEMYNDKNEPFLQGQSGKCLPDFTVFPALPGASPSPGLACPIGTSVIIPDEPTVTRVWKCTDQTSGCRAKGIPPNNYTCADSSQTCLACATTTPLNTFPFGQCGSCKNNPKTQAQDPNCEDPAATKNDEQSRCTRKTKIDSKEFKDKCVDTVCVSASRSRDCLVCYGSSCETDATLCTDPTKPFCETSQPQRGFCLAGPAASPSPSPPTVRTACFFMDDKPITASSCSAAGAQPYDSHPKVVPLILTTPGKKTVFVRFISNLGATKDFQRVVNFTPDPKLTEVSCNHSISGSGSVVSITATAPGPRGKGKVKVGGVDAEIISWNETSGVITASLDKRIEGKNDVELTRDDGKTARSECSVGTTSVLFSAQSQCKPSGNFSADNVSVKIFANAPTTVETEKPEPIIDEKVKLDKDGKPSGFTPKLEKDKKYSLIVKTPGTLARRVDFETKGGTKNLDPTTLLIGDIAPAQNPDGKINAFDRSELTRQWSLVKDVQRSGDFNQDGRINSVDYACMRQNINQSDESFSPPSGAPSASPIASPFASPTATASASPIATPSATPSGTLPFRVSFDPNFTTIAIQGDMGVATSLTIDLTLTGGPGLKSVYVQYFENGVWGPTPPQTASILLL